MYYLIREIFLPPGCGLFVGVILLSLVQRRPKVATGGLSILFATLYLLSIPLVSMALTTSTHEVPARSVEEVRAFKAQAIVILGSGVYRDAPEYDGEARPSSAAYLRLAYGAFLAKALGRPPILVTGGFGGSLQDSEGFVSSKTLNDWGFEEVWMETEAEDTHQNALFSKELLDRHGVERIALVTSASHASRAFDEFRKVGLDVLACPTGFRTTSAREHGIFLLVPTHQHLNESSYAIRTHLARLWYKLRW